jgi:hypothetical protein
MGLFSWAKPVDKAIDIVGSVAKTGMDIWDNSTLTSQEKLEGFKDLLAATKSQATSISRRQLLWFVMGCNGFTILLAIMYNAMGMTERLDGLIVIMETWKMGWAFVGAVSFYFLTQVTLPGTKKE